MKFPDKQKRNGYYSTDILPIATSFLTAMRNIKH